MHKNKCVNLILIYFLQIHYNSNSLCRQLKVVNIFSNTMPPFLEPRDTGIVIVESSTLLFLNVVSLFGNAIICLAVYRKRQLRTTTNLFIVALAVCDLSSAVFVMPFSSAVLIKGEWIFGNVFCSVQAFFTFLNIHASPCLIALTAFNRYVRIVKTNMYNILFSMGKCKLWISSVYVVVTTYFVTQVVVGNQKIQFVPGYAVCTTMQLSEAAKVIHYSFVVPVFVVSPIVITTHCCFRIFKTIRRHNRDILSSVQNGSSFYLNISRRELKVSISLFVVVIVFAFCWIPLWVLALMFRFKLVSSLSRNVTLFIMVLVFVSSTINPFIYAGINETFRNEFGRFFKCMPPSNRDSHSIQLRQ